MKKLLLALAIACLEVIPVQAQQTTTPVYCNASAVMDLASDTKGITQLLTAPMIGGINVCGYSLDVSGVTTTVGVQLGYGTATTGAAFFPITPGWQFTSATTSFFIDATPNGVLWIPPGNALELSATIVPNIQAQVKFFEQYPGQH